MPHVYRVHAPRRVFPHNHHHLLPHACSPHSALAFLHNYNEEYAMEFRYFVITSPQGFKVHLRTAVSGTLSIIPAPNLVRTKEAAGLLEDRIHMDIHMGKEPQQVRGPSSHMSSGH